MSSYTYVPRSQFIEVSDNDGGALPPPPPQTNHTTAAPQSAHSTPASTPGIAMSHSWATIETAGTAGTSGTAGNKSSSRAAARQQQLRQEIAQQRNEVMRRLHETGEIDTVRAQLRSQLMECGWRDEMKALVRQAMLERGGIGRVSLEELVEELKPRSQSVVPENVKSDLMHNVTSFIRRERGEAAPDEVEVVLRPGMSEV